MVNKIKLMVWEKIILKFYGSWIDELAREKYYEYSERHSEPIYDRNDLD